MPMKMSKNGENKCAKHQHQDASIKKIILFEYKICS